MINRTKTVVHQICVVIPAFKVKAHVIEVIGSIGPEVQKIIVVDDACPEKSGHHVFDEYGSKSKCLIQTTINPEKLMVLSQNLY